MAERVGLPETHGSRETGWSDVGGLCWEGRNEKKGRSGSKRESKKNGNEGGGSSRKMVEHSQKKHHFHFSEQ